VSGSEIDNLLESAALPGRAGHRALGRLLRLIDDLSPDSDLIDEKVKGSAFRAARIGLTGPPGSGKSSLIAHSLELLATEEGSSDRKIGVLAVDPTSPFTGGAILGDRVRLKGPVTDNVFFRSLASRGSLGGVSRAIWLSTRVLDWWGAEFILIETVGSGQLGTGVADVADLVVAVLTPEAGDGIQSMKAGVMELADCFIVNKTDRPGGDLVLKELKLVKEEAASAGRILEVFPTSATNGDGVREAVDGVRELFRKLSESGEIGKRRVEQVRREIRFRTEASLQAAIVDKLGGKSGYFSALDEWVEKIMAGDATVSEAASSLSQ